MGSLISLIQRVFSWIGRVFAWMFGAAKKTTSLPPWVYQALHWLVIILITVLLAVFSTKLPEGDHVTGHWFLRRCFYGILFFALYLFVRFAIYVIRLFFIKEEPEFPDILEAWQAGLKGLARQGLDIQRVPIFLILGLPETEEAHFFAGLKLKTSVVAPAVEKKDAPLRFFGNRDALFISCSGVSAICRQLRSDLTTWFAQPSQVMAPSADGGFDPAALQTIQPGQMPMSAQTLQPGQMAAPSKTVPPGQVAAPKSSATRQPPPLSKRELSECGRRLRFLCRLVSRSRAPFCPVNGALLWVPFSWSARGKEPIHQVVAADVQTLHNDLQMLFPAVWVFSGLDQFPGFQEFQKRAAQVDPRFGPHARAGSHFPMGHPIDSHSAAWVVGRGLDWFRQWVYSAFANDLAASSNRTLYRLLCDLEMHRQKSADLVRNSLGGVNSEANVRLSGCYFSGYDPAARRHVFVRDVVTKLIGDQDSVAWNAAYAYRDRACRNWSSALYAAIAVLALADVALLGLLIAGAG